VAVFTEFGGKVSKASHSARINPDRVIMTLNAAYEDNLSM